MDNQQFSSHPTLNAILTGISVICGAFTLLAEVEPLIRVVAGVTAIAAGLFTARYHYYATKEKINHLKNGRPE